MLSDEQIGRYLHRIGLDERRSPDVDFLSELTLAHQSQIPFETVSLHRSGKTPSMNVDDIYDKVVNEKLGGYCFELNKLFNELLLGLGYDARPVLSRAVRGREGRMPINHRGIIVDIDGKAHSVDVGFGGPMPSGALALDVEGDQVIGDDVYSVGPMDGGWLSIERRTRAANDMYDDEVPIRRQVELELCTATVEDQDFDALNSFFSMPGTLFRDHELVNLRTKDGYLGYKDGILTVRENGTKSVIEIPEENVNDMLSERFGMKGI